METSIQKNRMDAAGVYLLLGLLTDQIDELKWQIAEWRGEAHATEGATWREDWLKMCSTQINQAIDLAHQRTRCLAEHKKLIVRNHAQQTGNATQKDAHLSNIRDQLDGLANEAGSTDGELSEEWYEHVRQLTEQATAIVEQRTRCLADCDALRVAGEAEHALHETQNASDLLDFKNIKDEVDALCSAASEASAVAGSSNRSPLRIKKERHPYFGLWTPRLLDDD